MTRTTYRNGDPITLRSGCDGCSPVVRINGILAHEAGCPDAWRDARAVCRLCGDAFARTYRRQDVCGACLEDRAPHLGAFL